MQIKLHPTACLNEIGKRDNNEDSIFPVAGYTTAATRLFMVCDGVGGSAKGEEASRLACQSFAAYCEKHPTALPDADYINAALQYTEAAFDASLAANPNQKGMGTTVTLLCLHAGGITAAHIGDSRIYHVRKGEIKWATSDHSLVNDYLKAGILTPETAINHPQKNVITRALQGASVRPTRADVHIITDIAADDYIFMCTDGILESVSDADLCRILGDNRLTIEDQIAQINNFCKTNSRDNFSCYLLKIASVEGDIIPQYGLAQATITATENSKISENNAVNILLNNGQIATQNVATNNASASSVAHNTPTENTPQPAKNQWFMYIAIGLTLSGVLAFGAMNYFKKPNQPIKKTTTEIVPSPPPENHNYIVVETPVRPQNTATTTAVLPTTAQNTPVQKPAPTKPLPTAATAQAEAIVTAKPVPVPPKTEPAKKPHIPLNLSKITKDVIEQSKPNPQQPK